MSKYRKLLTALLVFCMVFPLCVLKSQAAEQAGPYTYTIRFYAGNQGTFAGTGGVRVLDEQGIPAGGTAPVLEQNGTVLTVSGLKAGYRVNFPEIQDGAVKLRTDSRYYVRGLRRSGYDNDTVDAPSFLVEQDQDYVVAYGVVGDQVSYVVHYRDTDGNRLAPSRTYQGNVGDRPVVAFLYIEGYRPQAYNLTRTLSKNEAENVFTFVYERTGGSGGGGGTGGGAGEEQPPAGAPEPGAAQPAAPAPVPAAAPAGGAPAGGGAAAAGGDAGKAGVQPGVEAPDEEVPREEEPDEVRRLDEDEKVPLIDTIQNLPENGTARILGASALGIAAAAALLLLIFFWQKQRREHASDRDSGES